MRPLFTGSAAVSSQLASPFSSYGSGLIAMRAILTGGLLAAWAGVAAGQWAVVNLHPEGASSSRALGGSASTQVGLARFQGGYYTYASMWSGSAASWVNLAPAGIALSEAHGAGPGVQVGEAWYPGPMGWQVRHAAIWSGTSQSWVALHPAGATDSRARATDGVQQVGRFGTHACLWTGTPDSIVDLNPPGATGSSALGVRDGFQVGHVSGHASLWNGTAESWVDLRPPLGTVRSEAIAVADGQQVGYFKQTAFAPEQACLWSGTAASFVDLTPPGALNCRAWGVDGGIQVGSAALPNGVKAIMWRGTAESWQNIGLGLEPRYSDTWAFGIWRDAVAIYIAGSGYHSALQREEALLWVRGLCSADLTAGSTVGAAGYGLPDGILDADDLHYYLAQLSVGNAPVADLTTGAMAGSVGYGVPNGVINNDDFFYYLLLFAAGC